MCGPCERRRTESERMMRAIRRLEARLQGEPDAWLTTALLLVAGVLIVVALAGPATLKAAALAWAVFP